jgi:hypothetical protein
MRLSVERHTLPVCGLELHLVTDGHGEGDAQSP